MKKFFCDRCGGPNATEGGLKVSHSTFDICNDCIDKLMDFMADGLEERSKESD